MSQDIISDVLNEIMNAKKARKTEIETSRYSKFLIEILKIAKNHGYLDFKLDEKSKKLDIKIKKLNECRTIKPRFNVQIEDIEKYVRRFLPARDFGIIIISTSKGLMTQAEAYENKIGGSLIAYLY